MSMSTDALLQPCSDGNELQDQKPTESSLNRIIKGFRERQPEVGAKSRLQQLRDPTKYVELKELVKHLSRRLEAYQTMLQDMTVIAPEHCGFSGLWQVVAVLGQIHLEFKDADPFMQSLVCCFDDDVRKCLQDVQPEQRHKNSQAPWTDDGKKAEEELINYLANADRDWEQEVREQLYGQANIAEALELLRSKSKKGNGVEVRLTDAQLQEFESRIYKRLFPNKAELKFWDTGSFARAFQIGFADLWKAKDYKALVYVLRKADYINEEMDKKAATGPFAWLSKLTSLSGPHMSKFKGDSDSVMLLYDRLVEVKTRVLPNFVQHLMKLDAVLQEDMSNISSARIQLLTTGGAFLVGAFNFVIPYVVQYFAAIEVD